MANDSGRRVRGFSAEAGKDEDWFKAEAGKRKKRRGKKGPALFILILIFLIAGIVCGIYLYKKYSPGKTRADLNEYYKVQGTEAAVIVNRELTDIKALYDDGVYLDYETVKNDYNDKFYFDRYEKLLLFTTPDKLITIAPDQTAYTVNKSDQDFGSVIFKISGDTAYINIDFVKQYASFSYEVFKDPARVCITTPDKASIKTAEVKRKAAIRWRAGIKSDILEDVARGDNVVILDEHVDDNGFIKVMGPEATIGYMKEKRLRDYKDESVSVDKYTPEEYTHISHDGKIVLGWHQVITSAGNASLSSTLDSSKGINVISPTWMQVKGDKGDVTDLASDEYISTAHGRGLEVWPLIDDFAPDFKIGDVLKKTSVRQKLEKNIMAEAIKYSFDGINIDFENVQAENGDDFVQFVREMGIMCRNNGIILSIDNYPPTDSSEYYNRAAQAEAADYVVTMAYDEHYANDDEAGPTADMPFIKDSVDNTLNEVPKEQAIIGLPFYCRLWTESSKEGDTSIKSEAYSMKTAPSVLANAGVNAKWDDKLKMNWGSYTDNDGNKYSIWIEDLKSMKEKLAYVKDADTAGMAFWKLGLEVPEVWPEIRKANQ
jgi:spore germination protein YaaH